MRKLLTTAERLACRIFPGLTPGAAAVVSAVTVGFAVMFVLFPTCSDDFWYMLPPDHAGGVWSGLREIWRSHWQGDNIRLANIVFSLFALLPKWIGSLLAGLCVAPVLTLMLRMSGGKVGMTAAVWASALFTLLLPWNDQIAVMCFQFNYVVASLLALTVFYLFMDGRRRPLWVYLLAGFITGWWHEGFSVSVACALTAAMVLRPGECLYRRGVCLVVGLVAGTAILFTAPGATGRMAETGTALSPALLSVLRYYPAAIIFAVLWTVCMLWPRMRREATGAFCIVVIVVIIVNIAIHVLTAFAPRIGWCAELFAIAGIVRLGRNLWQGLRPGRVLSVTAAVATAAVAGLLLVHLVVADIMTWRVRRSTEAVYAAYQKGDDMDGVVFADFPTAFDAPFIAFQKPYYDIFTYWWNNMRAQRYLGRDVPLRAIPAVLADVDGSQGEVMPGGARRIGHVFYMRDDGRFDDSTLDAIEDGWSDDGLVKIRGRNIRRQLHLAPFVSRRDGRRYIWIYPINTALRATGSSVEDIRLQ